MSKKSIVVSTLAVMSLGILGGVTPANADVNASETSVSSSEVNDAVVTETVVPADGTEVRIVWDQVTNDIQLFAGSSLIGETTMAEVQEELGRAPGSQVGAPMATASANTCDYMFAGVGMANTVLWAAAGVTAVAPPAAAVAAAGGVVTTAILTGGSLAAC
ncbi:MULTISPECIES: hypothetical protein [Kocuria]|uniref:Uncharacterized protein n=1 Tax=Kocuria subflava TaxID=1736139 RepID=A0A846TTP9_9MICC|nr:MULTISPECIES: hypothetical protein [Kocuria]NKE10159.1 hypothetical protein [Kocuria subflava]